MTGESARMPDTRVSALSRALAEPSNGPPEAVERHWWDDKCREEDREGAKAHANGNGARLRVVGRAYVQDAVRNHQQHPDARDNNPESMPAVERHGSPVYSEPDEAESTMTTATSLPIPAEFGDHFVATSGSYQCSCMHGSTMGFGGGQTVPVKRPGNLQSVPPDSFTYRSLGNYLKTRIWQVFDDQGQTWTISGTSVTESYQPISNGCNVQIQTGSAATNVKGASRTSTAVRRTILMRYLCVCPPKRKLYQFIHARDRRRRRSILSSGDLCMHVGVNQSSVKCWVAHCSS
jgi:hypothetical protein